MLQSTEILIDAGLAAKVFTTSDLKRVLKGTPASRYALVNKALTKGELIQLKRGVYTLNQKYSSYPFSKFYVAAHMVLHSYISLESALSYHGWIPENVMAVSSIVHKGRTKSFTTPLGEFHYHFIPIQPYEFLTGVVRKEYEGQPFLIAHPLRALADYVYEKKIQWRGVDFLTDSLRIDIENLINLTTDDFATIKQVYHSKRVVNFLNKLENIR